MTHMLVRRYEHTRLRSFRVEPEELLNVLTRGGCGGSSYLWDIFPCALSANIRSIPGRGLKGWGDL